MNKKKNQELIRKDNKNLPVPANSLEKYLAEISNYKILTKEQEMKYALDYKETGNVESARKLITSNLKFVVKIAIEYKNYGLNIMDIIQEGNLGLMKAITKFDPTKRYRLISYGVWWIRAYIQNFIMKNWSLIKIGTTQAQRKLFYKIRSAKNKYDKGNMTREDYYKTLSDDLKISIKEIREMDLRMSGKEFSLDEQIIEGEPQTKLDFLESNQKSQEEISIDNQQSSSLKKGLEKALSKLDEREKFIIENRLLTENQKTLEDIGKQFKISRERVRQIEKSAITKIRKILTKMGIKADF
tara:strand:+ start:3240 stop:4136 length:897 start_codon:yes stop_codon:yes gene_type:complete